MAAPAPCSLERRFEGPEEEVLECLSAELLKPQMRRRVQEFGRFLHPDAPDTSRLLQTARAALHAAGPAPHATPHRRRVPHAPRSRISLVSLFGCLNGVCFNGALGGDMMADGEVLRAHWVKWHRLEQRRRRRRLAAPRCTHCGQLLPPGRAAVPAVKRSLEASFEAAADEPAPCQPRLAGDEEQQAREPSGGASDSELERELEQQVAGMEAALKALESGGGEVEDNDEGVGKLEDEKDEEGEEDAGKEDKEDEGEDERKDLEEEDKDEGKDEDKDEGKEEEDEGKVGDDGEDKGEGEAGEGTGKGKKGKKKRGSNLQAYRDFVKRTAEGLTDVPLRARAAAARALWHQQQGSVVAALKALNCARAAVGMPARPQDVPLGDLEAELRQLNSPPAKPSRFGCSKDRFKGTCANCKRKAAEAMAFEQLGVPTAAA